MIETISIINIYKQFTIILASEIFISLISLNYYENNFIQNLLKEHINPNLDQCASIEKTKKIFDLYRFSI